MASAVISQRSSLFLSAKVNWSYLNLRFHISSFLFQRGISPTWGIISPIENVFKDSQKISNENSQIIFYYYLHIIKQL